MKKLISSAVLALSMLLLFSSQSRAIDDGYLCDAQSSPECVGVTGPKEMSTNADGRWICSAGSTNPDNTVTCGYHFMPSGGTKVGNLDFNQLNQTIFGGLTSQLVAFQTPRGIISYLLPFLFTLAGLILFVMLVWGGFEMLTGAADPKSQQAGQQRITAAIIGFLIIFAAYWIAQLLQTIFGISILG